MRTRFLISSGLSDMTILAGAVALSSEVLFQNPIPWNTPELGRRVIPGLVVVVLGAVFLSLITLYMTGPGVPRPSYGRAVAIAAGSFLGLAGFAVVSRSYFSRPLIGFIFTFWTIGMLVQRFVRRRRPWVEKLALVTAERVLADDLVESPHADVVAVWNGASDVAPQPLDSSVTLAVDLRSVLSPRMAQFVSSSDISGVPVRPLTSVYEEHTGRIPLVHLAEGWEIAAPTDRKRSVLLWKRLTDTLLVFLSLPIWLPIGLIVALSVRMSSPGPVIFRQERVGYLGRPFTMYKFRTMCVGSENNGPRFALDEDDRIVRGGRFLRKARLDELPQLWNVLKGDMALVGPRAEQVPFVKEYEREIPFYGHRHLVRPGITGWAQVKYGYADDLADTIDKLTYDLYYIKHMSPIMDLKILWESVAIVVTGRGAR